MRSSVWDINNEQAEAMVVKEQEYSYLGAIEGPDTGKCGKECNAHATMKSRRLELVSGFLAALDDMSDDARDDVSCAEALENENHPEDALARRHAGSIWPLTTRTPALPCMSNTAKDQS
ncbi:hypothetical protein F4604DRAFT_1902542 [Suillus subluteus]|nr:hypothetical protein F4604DRAFT_1902542 [Suillus subluteus]